MVNIRLTESPPSPPPPLLQLLLTTINTTTTSKTKTTTTTMITSTTNIITTTIPTIITTRSFKMADPKTSTPKELFINYMLKIGGGEEGKCKPKVSQLFIFYFYPIQSLTTSKDSGSKGTPCSLSSSTVSFKKYRWGSLSLWSTITLGPLRCAFQM